MLYERLIFWIICFCRVTICDKSFGGGKRYMSEICSMAFGFPINVPMFQSVDRSSPYLVLQYSLEPHVHKDMWSLQIFQLNCRKVPLAVGHYSDSGLVSQILWFVAFPCLKHVLFACLLVQDFFGINSCSSHSLHSCCWAESTRSKNISHLASILFI